MSDKTSIQWTDATWNAIRGCSRVSAGCQHCYAEAVAARFSGPGQPYEGLARRRSNGEPQWTGEVRVIEKHMLDPLRWQKPRRIFVNSMSDLFHESLDEVAIAEVFAVMSIAQRHTFQVLTKRPERMQQLLTDDQFFGLVHGCVDEILDQRCDPNNRKRGDDRAVTQTLDVDEPLPNVWLGVSVENQDAANERIPQLVETPAAIRFLSCEPLLGPIDFYEAGSLGPEVGDPFAFSALRGTDGTEPRIPGIDWVIIGGESGRGARECDLQWVRNIVAQCATRDVACFVKQLGANPVDPWADTGALLLDRAPARPVFRDSHGGDIDEWPNELRVREFPAVQP